MSKIFISYRRDDTPHVTDHVYDYMRGQFGDGNVFLDVGSVPVGADFRQHINDQIAAHAVVLVMIGPQWAQMMRDRAGQANDFVRIEIESALRLNKLVIPVRVMGADLPDFSTLPTSIQDLQWRNAAEIRRKPDFDGDCARLAQGITDYLARQATMAGTPFVGASAAPAAPTTPAIVRQPPPPPSEPPAGTRRVDDFGIPMVYVPAGKFLMGSTVGEGNADERPQHEQIISTGFWLDLTPVTNASYARFSAAGGYKNPEFWAEAGWEWVKSSKKVGPQDFKDCTDPQQPRLGVSWFEAWAYSQWRGGRLPTEAEWEWAARGPENRAYPWGNTFDSNHLIYAKNSGNKTAAVGDGFRKAGASWVGALDMSGNAWEWCSSLYQPYPYRVDISRENRSDGSNMRVLRGGSWRNLPLNAHAAFRYYAHPFNREGDIGFRVVCDSPSPGR
jgi:formylglycine-generating enzyme required for sulfatase activity